VAGVPYVFTAARVAKMLGVAEEIIDAAADGLDPEDGRLWVYDDTEHGVMAFTSFGIESLCWSLTNLGHTFTPPPGWP
jgi:hypothetical protein